MSSIADRTSSLNAAKAAKNDEFYTQWADREREVNAYLEFNPNAFRGKVVLLPCDDPEWSNFAKYFALHLANLGLKKLTSTSYAPDSNPLFFSSEPTLFELGEPKFDSTKTKSTEMDADHVTAWSKGGSTSLSNLTMLCVTHNRGKGNR
ncbi:MAG TPA: adenine-specific methyltransferase EcoRI family protein [Arachnia sp.]|nr:adenine-specific methyltransferase EcoRI family protein [Arachnia sp.]HMT87125.1 adenine-specific methyltransferase EcoRI family protein [Arachnia sp.]